MSRAQLTSTVEQNTGGAVSPYVAGKNKIINGDFGIWQRGTSIPITTNSYTADRFFAYRGVAGLTVSRRATNDTTNLPFIQYCARVQRDSGNTATTAIFFGQSLESATSIPLAGRSVTFSFYVRKGADFSGANIAFRLNSGTGTDENIILTYTGAFAVANVDVVPTTTWTRYSITGTMPATGTEIAFQANYAPTGTALAADYYEITGVQLEVGSVATPFTTATGTLQGELAACQRYYYLTSSADGAYTQYGIGQAYLTSAAKFNVPFPVTMRIAPTSVSVTGNIGCLNSGNTVINNGTISVDAASKDRGSLVITGSSGLTAGNATAVLSNASTATSLAFSAEL